MILHRLFTLLLLCSLLLLSGCDLIEGIFKAGFWAAIILILLVVFLIGYLIFRFQGKT